MIADAQFNRATLDCMNTLRRALKRNVGITVHLGDPDAAQSMIGLSRDSDDADIRDLGRRLEDMLTPQTSELDEHLIAQGAIASRQYHVNAQRRSERSEEPAPSSPSGSVRIYRGQVIR